MEVIRGTPQASQPPPPRPTTRGDPLPMPARTKLIGLQGATVDARDAATSAQRRSDDLRSALNYGDEPPKDAANIEFELSRLHAVRERQNYRHRELAALTATITHWLATLGPLASFEMAKPPAVKLLKDETVTDAITRARDEIEALKQHLRAVQSAPLPIKDLKEAARAHVDKLAASGRPRVSGQGGEFKADFSTASFGPPGERRYLELLAWLHPDALVTALEKEIDGLPKPKLTLTAAEKQKRLVELRDNLDTLERQEETLIEKAVEQGLDLLRRPLANPLAVLGIVPKAKVRVRT